MKKTVYAVVILWVIGSFCLGIAYAEVAAANKTGPWGVRGFE